MKKEWDLHFSLAQFRLKFQSKGNYFAHYAL